jgi:hypothetical protein
MGWKKARLKYFKKTEEVEEIKLSKIIFVMRKLRKARKIVLNFSICGRWRKNKKFDEGKNILAEEDEEIISCSIYIIEEKELDWGRLGNF